MKILITAGPTREAIDPVRYISNRSSGKMGYAIAAAATSNGHEVILISGPVHLPSPVDVDLITVESSREMFEAVQSKISDCEAAVFCAAVSDYRPVVIAEEKIKKTGSTMTLTLEKTEDILGSCRPVFKFEGLLMGFAAETENLIANATGKLQRKGCDFLVANDVSRKDIGFDRDENEVIIISADGSHKALPIQEKRVIGEQLIRLLEAAQSKR